MKRMKVIMTSLLGGCLLLGWGCDIRQSPPTTRYGEAVKKVVPENAAEMAVVQTLVDASTTYEYRLNVLKQYYMTQRGAYAKGQWADDELRNLLRAWTFTFEGVTPADVPAAPALDQANEATLVEQVIAAREDFLVSLQTVRTHYVSAGRKLQAGLVENVNRRLDPLLFRAYFLDAEVPPADLRPVAVISAAEVLYSEALGLHKAGKHVLLPTGYRKERQALAKFQELIRTYPNSTKIALSAFYVGEIYRKFKHNYRAVAWYERAWQWDPNLPKPARYRAATVWDRRLHHRERALQLYREAVQHETFHGAQVNSAQRRIAELSGVPAG